MALLALGASGCGEAAETDATVVLAPAPRPSGTLTIATAAQVTVLDPLFARTRAERLAARQIYEPLVSDESGPFDARRVSGLAQRVAANRQRTIWRIVLRRDVRFQSGEPLDAEAVIANVDRWRRIDRASRLLRGLRAADSPRPGLVRLIFGRPTAGVEETLAQPRLGLVAPSALRDAGVAEVRPGPNGCGPFEYRGRSGDRFTLARSIGWWGEDLGLGPGVDQIELDQVPAARDRVAGLVAGAFDVADELGARARRLTGGSLLATVGRDASTMGLDRSVRGIDSASQTQSLADVWLTDLR